MKHPGNDGGPMNEKEKENEKKEEDLEVRRDQGKDDGKWPQQQQQSQSLTRGQIGVHQICDFDMQTFYPSPRR